MDEGKELRADTETILAFCLIFTCLPRISGCEVTDDSE
jgi:hypothetical protein